MFEPIPRLGVLLQTRGRLASQLLPLLQARVSARRFHNEAAQVKVAESKPWLETRPWLGNKAWPEIKMEDRKVPAGLLGRYYAARHSHGQYRSSAVTGRYNFSIQGLQHPEKQILDIINYSVSKTIERHPSLSYGLTEKNKSHDAQFIRLSNIQIDDVLELTPSFETDRDAVLTKHLGTQHDRLFTNPHHKPAWRLAGVVHKKTLEDGYLSVDLSFIGHHAISDGISDGAFHRTLSQHLYEAAQPNSGLKSKWPYHVPSTTPAPIPVEAAFHFPAPPRALPFTTGLSTISPPPLLPWAGNPPSLHSYATKLHFLTIPSAHLNTIRQKCHTLGITLTSLLHTLLIIHLSRTHHTAQTFQAITPYSMRPFTSTPNTEITNHISYLTTNFPSSLLLASRAVWENSPEESLLIQQVSQKFHGELEKECSEIPTKGSPALNTIAKIPDFDEFCKGAMDQPRENTYELSNIGVVDFDTPIAKTSTSEKVGREAVWLEKLVFSQCGMVVGPAFGCSVVTVKNGDMTLCLHWQAGILEDGMMEDIGKYLERRLLNMGEARK